MNHIMKKVMKHLARKWHHKLGVPCCCLLLAAFLTSLATMHQGRLLSHGRNWQLHALLSPIFCLLSKKAQPRHAKCVRQVARSKQQLGSTLKLGKKREKPRRRNNIFITASTNIPHASLSMLLTYSKTAY